MKLSYVFFFIFLFIRCDNAIDVDYGPCKFAPPESKFPELLFAYCDECYFTLQFAGKKYSFVGKQLETIPSEIVWEPPDKTNLIQLIRNSFLSFYFIAPATAELLNNSRGIKTPLLKLDTLSKLKSNGPPPVSASFGIYNYCKNLFEPIGNINQSYHRLTDTELIESYFVGTIGDGIERYQKYIFYCSGELQATFIINGETQVATASYKVRAEIWEKL
jgi:hypothetical protein